MNPQTSQKYKVYVFWILAIIAIGYGTYRAASVAYVNDDAFISFRYAKNFANGLGLVYNTGERVEGYTNFLWTVIIALGMKFNCDPVSFSMTLGIIFSSLTLVVYSLLTWKLQTFRESYLSLFPLAAVALSLHRDFNIYATSGLETSLFTFMVTCIFASLLLGNSTTSDFRTGTFAVFAMMARPDGAIFLVMVFLYVLLTSDRPVRRYMKVLAPCIVLFLPYWIWRFNYYGYFFPNSFYAKSAGLAYYSQGFSYALLYFKTYYVFSIILFLAAVVLWRHRNVIISIPRIRRLLSNSHRVENISHPVLLGSLFFLAYSFYTIRVGGDFMFARFFVPVTPILYFITEILITNLFARFPHVFFRWIVVVATLLRFDQFSEGKTVANVTDEYQLYTAEHLKQAQQKGENLHKIFDGLPVKIAFWGSQARLIYYADPAVAIESNAGLTDAYIAHQPITTRGIPGHEKKAPKDYLIQRKVNFIFGSFTEPEGTIFIDKIKFGDIPAKIVVYENSIMSKLEQHQEVKFIPFPLYLDDYISKMKLLSRERVKQDYQNFSHYYFDHNSDPERQKPFLLFFQ